MSMKIERVNNSILRELSYILANEIKDQNIRFVTVTSVKTTNDLSFAKVYYTILDDSKKEEAQKAFKSAAGFIRHELMDRIDIRYVPELEFVYDESIEYGKMIENKIKEIHKED